MGSLRLRSVNYFAEYQHGAPDDPEIRPVRAGRQAIGKQPSLLHQIGNYYVFSLFYIVLHGKQFSVSLTNCPIYVRRGELENIMVSDNCGDRKGSWSVHPISKLETHNWFSRVHASDIQYNILTDIQVEFYPYLNKFNTNRLHQCLLQRSYMFSCNLWPSSVSHTI